MKVIKEEVFSQLMQFGKIHCDEIKKKETISMTQFHIEIEKTFVPVTNILKTSAY